ncbi:MAG: type 1 glutamine amidotransferase [Cytophagaceae bacterium]|nr:type 1 glutamine amidotransferase [Cytophagaceae bacterium]
MNIHYFQHVSFEGLAHLSQWVDRPGNKVTATRFYEDHKLPFVEICDLLIVMGGPMSVNDESDFNWLTEEKRFIEKAIVRGKSVVGICLGAQLIADVLGSRVYKNQEKEIGWWPVQLTEEGKRHPLMDHFGASQEVFHWHGETFDLPTGAVRLAGSKWCENQAFVYGKNVLGLQFHLESTTESIAQLLHYCHSDLSEGPAVQTPEAIAGSAAQLENCQYLLEQTMNKLISIK